MPPAVSSDVRRPTALPTANLRSVGARQLDGTATSALDSAEALNKVDADLNSRVDADIDTLANGLIDLIQLAAVRLGAIRALGLIIFRPRLANCFSLNQYGALQVGDRSPAKVAHEAYQVECRAETMVGPIDFKGRG